MKNVVFWDVTPCSSRKNRRFGGMSVLTRATWRNIPKDGILLCNPAVRRRFEGTVLPSLFRATTTKANLYQAMEAYRALKC
jgi:hypothetical protein